MNPKDPTITAAPVTAASHVPTCRRISRSPPTKMGISHSVSRFLAPLSFLLNFSSQLYGLLSVPNLQDIDQANLSFFSPHPCFVGAFFVFQQVLQIAWLYRLVRPNPRGRLSFLRNTDPVKQDWDDDVALMVDYAPYFAAGSLCIAGGFIFLVFSLRRFRGLFRSSSHCSGDSLLTSFSGLVT